MGAGLRVTVRLVAGGLFGAADGADGVDVVLDPPTYMDDSAFMVEGTCPQDVLERLACAIAILYRLACAFGCIHGRGRRACAPAAIRRRLAAPRLLL